MKDAGEPLATSRAGVESDPQNLRGPSRCFEHAVACVLLEDGRTPEGVTAEGGVVMTTRSRADSSDHAPDTAFEHQATVRCRRAAAIANDTLVSRALLTAAMDRYVCGENEDFATVYQLLAPRLIALLLARGCSAATAEDLLQQAFLRIHRARGRYKLGRDVAPWIVAIVRRLYVDHWRRSRREVLESSLEARQDASNPEADAIADELAKQIAMRLVSLPSTQRRAFELVRLRGVSLAQAADILGTTTTAIKLRLRRADHALRAAVSGTGAPLEARRTW